MNKSNSRSAIRSHLLSRSKNDGNGDSERGKDLLPSSICSGIDKVKRGAKRVGAAAVAVRRESLDRDDDDKDKDTDTGPRVRRNTSNNLATSIDFIETLQSIEGLTHEQRAAINALRTSTAPSNNYRRMASDSERSGDSERSFHRREAKFFGASGIAAAYTLTRDLVACFHEVETNKEDKDQQSNVTAVLANYGGEIFDKFSVIAPHPRRNRGVLTKEIAASARFEVLAESMLTNNLSPSSSFTSLESFDEPVNFRPRREAIACFNPLSLTSSLADFHHSESLGDSKVYCPPEWNLLTISARAELTSLLSWESLSQWDFNVLNVAKLSGQVMRSTSMDDRADLNEQCCPLLLVGWAILCAPKAQQAMEGSLGDINKKETIGPSDGKKSVPYDFEDIHPDKVCNFLREIERRYNHDLPYHNNTHAADVTQTLHCMLQFLGEDLLDIYGPVKIFSILLAATFHDVGHPGANNLFQKNTRTQVAIRYNDVSILENMHSYVGHSLLMGDDKRDEWDVFAEWISQDIDAARNVMMGSVLGTDMSHHFEAVGKLAGLVEKVKPPVNGTGENELEPVLSILARVLGPANDDEEESLKKDCSMCANYFLNFLMHAADISNPTKKVELATHWADMALAEFFNQGDKEEALQLPISPLCDRRTVKKPDSQIGFLKFVIRPTFSLLGELIPRVKEEVMPIIDGNIDIWTKEKARMSVRVTANVVHLARRASVRVATRNMQGVPEESSSDDVSSRVSGLSIHSTPGPPEESVSDDGSGDDGKK